MTTYTGICQACGRRQAIHIRTGLIAKHGYTTEYSFFNGTCQGSDNQPLELDTAVNVAVVAGLTKWAAEKDAAAAGEITKVAIEVRTGLHDNRGRAIKQSKLVDRAEYEATQPSYMKFDDAVESVRRRLRRSAEIARADAAALDTLRGKVHGQPLQERPEEAPIQRESFETYREAYARVEELKAAGHKAQQRRERWSRNYIVTYR